MTHLDDARAARKVLTSELRRSIMASHADDGEKRALSSAASRLLEAVDREAVAVAGKAPCEHLRPITVDASEDASVQLIEQWRNVYAEARRLEVCGGCGAARVHFTLALPPSPWVPVPWDPDDLIRLAMEGRPPT